MVGGYLSLLYSISNRPLEYWSKHQSQTGRIRKILDSDLLENVVEIQDFERSNAASTSIVCPSDPCQLLDVRLPFLVIVMKNLNVECRLKIQIVDDKNVRHHFQFFSMDFERDANVRDPVVCRSRVKLEPGWNKLELDLCTLSRTAFRCQYGATQRLEICANCRLRRVYFIHRHYADNEICPALCQAFLDVYMLKWGIHLLERATQTDGSARVKNKITRQRDDTSKAPINNSANKDDVVPKEPTSSGNSNPSRSNDVLTNASQRFLRTLQIKSNKLISDFFGRQTHKVSPSAEFRHLIVSKPYVVPAVRCPHPRIADPAKIWEERANGLQTLSFHTLDEQRRAESRKLNDIAEKWTCRYFSAGKQHMNESFRRNVPESRTMLKNRSDVLTLTEEAKGASEGESVDVEKSNVQDFAVKDDKDKSDVADEGSPSERSSRKTARRFRNVERRKLKALSNEAFQFKDTGVFDEHPTIGSLTAKREDLVQKTISDLRRTYMNFVCTNGNVREEKNDYFLDICRDRLRSKDVKSINELNVDLNSL